MVPQELDDPVPEERHQVYKILRLLQVMVRPDEPPEVNGTFGGGSGFCGLGSSSRSRWTPILMYCPAWVMRPQERWTRPWAGSVAVH